MMRKISQQWAAALWLAACTQASAGVLPVVDVNNPVSWPGAAVDVIHNHYQQHFSATQSGLLSGFGIFAAPGYTWQRTSVKIKIGGGDHWQTDGWLAQITPSLDGSLVDLTGFALHVNAGDDIVFDVGGGGSAFMVQHGLGALYEKNNFSDFPSRQTGRSLAFTTWMIPDPAVPDPTADVPAPGAGILTLLGLAMLALARRFPARRVH
ncbi:hypothetical protein [Duganella sp. Root336D2]|uniref:hypothetical protein n=1 Tax=Duganella sp. Root336D2 TaxID=1736518 RepID=UPI0006F6485B|nr:hypothetical protein [Duganella sp. Root336D2]KQV54258.1 hypothetical protein ASD07_06920 [Duganella sp. Root336D2]